MDPRKQKRLGPAPIASFEKSFEDTATPHHSGNAAVHNAIHQTETEKQDINRNSDEVCHFVFVFYTFFPYTP